MRVSDLQSKDVITVDGKKIGKIVDIEIETDGKIIYFVVEPTKLFRGIMLSLKETTISVSQIKTIGEDVILVETSN